MELHAAILLVPYIIGLVVFALLAAYSIYALRRFGAHTAGMTAVITLFGLGTAAVLVVTLIATGSIDWSQPLLAPELLSDSPLYP